MAFTDTDKELSLLAKLTNDADEYYAKLGATVSGDSSHATYHPLLEYKSPQKTGSLVSQKGTKGRPQKLQQPFSVDGKLNSHSLHSTLKSFLIHIFIYCTK